MVMFLLLYNMFGKQQINRNEIDYSEFRNAIERGEVEKVEIKENEIAGFFKEGFGPAGKDEFVSFPPPEDSRLIQVLRDAKVDFKAKPKQQESWYLMLLANWFPMLLLIGVWIFFMRQIQVGGGKAMSFGKSKARLLEEGPGKVTFDDVAGIEESKTELEHIVPVSYTHLTLPTTPYV